MSISRPQDRYIRQSQFAPIGDEGQQRIQNADVAILGCGALGSVAAELLTRAGVGKIRLIDRDLVEWSNLQRQSLYRESDAIAASAKAEAAANQLRRINSSIQIHECVVDINATNIDQHLRGCDLVIDASDNFGLRMLLNDWSLQTKTPWVHGGCVGASGQVHLFQGLRPCFRCLLPEVPAPGETETCDTAGVVGPATHMIASLQSAEALKWISGNRDAVNANVLSIDLWSNQIRSISMAACRQGDCPACVQHRYDFLNTEDATTQQTQTLCGRNAVQISGRCDSASDVDLERIGSNWKSIAEVQASRFFVRLVLSEEQSITLFRDGRAVISGVRDVSHARSLYDRYIGS